MPVKVTVYVDGSRAGYGLKVENDYESNSYKTDENGVVVMGSLSAERKSSIFVNGKKVISNEYPSIPNSKYPDDGEFFANY